jgi:hypothetical protein
MRVDLYRYVHMSVKKNIVDLLGNIACCPNPRKNPTAPHNHTEFEPEAPSVGVRSMGISHYVLKMARWSFN